MDFFDTDCQEPPLSNTLFGLCDDENGTKAYTNVVNSDRWVATVKNDNARRLVFTAVDKCVIKNDEYEGRGRCDAMLTSDLHLYLIELKDKRKSKKSGPIDQLESTIRFIRDHHNISSFRHKKAFACNKKGRRFQVIEQETNLHFWRTYGFRIDAQAEIIIT